MVCLRDWYTDKKMYYRSYEDPKTYGELDVLYQLLDNEFVIYTKKNGKSIDRLVIDGMLYESTSGVYKLDLKGEFLCKGLRERREMPCAKKLVSFLIEERKRNKLTQGDLSKNARITINKISRLEQFDTSSVPFVYIEDVMYLLHYYGINYYDVCEFIENKINRYKIIETSEISEFQSKKVDSNLNYLRTESPIETKLVKELILLKGKYAFDLYTQVEYEFFTKKYRVDIYIELKNKIDGIGGAVIECDGHEFHEKYKEQVIRDKKRDRAFLSMGISTIRFSGTEIYRNASICAEEVLNILFGRNYSELRFCANG